MATGTAWTTRTVRETFYDIVRDQPGFNDLLHKQPDFQLEDIDHLVERKEVGVESRLKFDSLEVVDIIISVEEELRVQVSDEAAEQMTGKTVREISGIIVGLMREKGIQVEDEEEDAA